MRDDILPAERSLLRLADLGDVEEMVPEGRTEVLASAPLLGWLLDELRPSRAAASTGPASALLGRIAGAGTLVEPLDPDAPEGALVLLDLHAEGATSVDPVLADALAAGRTGVALVLGDATALVEDERLVTVTLAHGGGMTLAAAREAAPVAAVAALSIEALDRWRRLHARLSRALVAEREVMIADGAIAALSDEGRSLRRELGRAEEEAARSGEEVERLRVRLTATEALRGELVHAYDRLDRVLASASWRLTAPIRTVLLALPPVRRALRSLLRLVVSGLSPRAWRERRSRRERYGHAETAVELAAAEGTRSSGALRREKEPGHVGWVASVGDPFTTRYRISNLSAALRSHGVRSTVVPSDGVDARLLEACETVVLCRVAWDDDVATEVARLRESGTRIVFDVDDLVFDPSRVGLTAPGPNRLAPRRHLFGRYRTTLLEADAVTVSTAPLRNEVVEIGRPVAIVPNNIGLDLLERWSAPVRRRVRASGRAGDAGESRTVRIGYLSGTATHVQDVREMAPALADVMRAHEEVELHVVGPVELPRELDGLRVVRHPLQRYHDLFALLATLDINLAPLELENDFTDGKSELKIFEAALLEVPTVASTTRPYAGAIEHGRSGMLAATSDEWRDAIGALVGDKDLRGSVGVGARTSIVPRFAAPAVAGVSAGVLRSVADADRLAVLPGDLGAVRGDLALLLPPDADWSEMREVILGLTLDPGAGRCVLLLAQGDPNVPLVRGLLASLAHGARGGGMPRLVTLSVGPSAPPAAVAAAVLSEARCSAIAVVPPDATIASGSIATALMALERFHAPVCTGVQVSRTTGEPALRRLLIDADLADRSETMLVAESAELADLEAFLPVMDRQWVAERPSVLAALVGGEPPTRVVQRLVAGGTSVTVAPALRGSVSGTAGVR